MGAGQTAKVIYTKTSRGAGEALPVQVWDLSPSPRTHVKLAQWHVSLHLFSQKDERDDRQKPGSQHREERITWNCSRFKPRTPSCF